MLEHTVLIAGPIGAGKTTAIELLGNAGRVEAGARDRSDAQVDYGEIALGADELVRLYGVPGGKRFDFMVVAQEQRAFLGLILVRNDSPDPVGDLVALLEEFRELLDRRAVVIGVTHRDIAPEPPRTDYQRVIDERHPGVVVPLFAVYARDRDQLRALLSALPVNRA